MQTLTRQTVMLENTIRKLQEIQRKQTELDTLLTVCADDVRLLATT
jgi:DNA-binding Xre family transcriptional regulator